MHITAVSKSVSPSLFRSGGLPLKTGEVLDKKYRAKQLNTSEVWSPILQSETFVNYLADRYAISSGDIMPDAEVLETLLESTDD